jgi:hypothetical protein
MSIRPTGEGIEALKKAMWDTVEAAQEEFEPLMNADKKVLTQRREARQE